jgi:serine protease
MMKRTIISRLVKTSIIAAAVLASNINHASVLSKDESATQTPIVKSISTNQIIVKYKESIAMSADFNAAQAVSAQVGLPVALHRTMTSGAKVLQINNVYTDAEMQSVIAEITKDPRVEYAEIDYMLQPLATANDTSYSSQWHYFESTGGINLPAAWDSSTGAGVTVAVLDTGYRPHTDLVGNIVGGYDMISSATVGNDGGGRDSDARDPGDAVSANECGYTHSARNSSWHGTHVAGTVAAVTNNNKGVAGVAYNAKVVPVRVLGKCGGSTSDIADGIVWASGGSVSGVPSNSNPAKVINLSLGGQGSCSQTTQNAINTARSNGSIIVIASGNSNANVSGFNPGNCSGIISVAATNRQGGRAYYSNYGALIDVAAPGGAQQSANDSDGVLSTLNSGSNTPSSDNYRYSQGTSMAAPHVAGVAALMASVKPSISPDEAESILKSTSRSFPATCSQCGSGIIDAEAAVAAADGGTTQPPTGGTLQKGVAKTGLSGSKDSQQFFTIDIPAGSSNLTFNMSGGSGDADLYVRAGAKPTLSTYDCRPWKGGNSESCSYASPSATTYHVMIVGYSAFSSVSLVADYTASSGGGTGGGTTKSNLSGSKGSWKHYTVTVPSGMSTFDVDISGGSGDADVYVRRGARPTSSTYDCRPWKGGNNESCSFNNPASGTWHISIYGYASYSGVKLVAAYNP